MTCFAEILPSEALHVLRTGITAEFATISAAGVPIDTPTFYFPNAALTSLDIGTGLAYPAKAERARRRPQVSILVEGAADQPVILIAGYAAVKDTDIQANLERYLAEAIFSPNIDPEVVPWEKTRKRLFYAARIIVAVTPAHVRWWPCRAAMDDAPNEWSASGGTVFAPSDPAPPAKPTAPAAWIQRDWQELADQAVAGGLPAHLTLIDADGYPAPISAKSCTRVSEGFRLSIPRSAPWHSGLATLSFVGKEIFLGEAAPDGEDILFCIERCLPILPMMDDRTVMKHEVLEALNARLVAELERRGLPMPVVPEEQPSPTKGAPFRRVAAKAMDVTRVGGGISR